MSCSFDPSPATGAWTRPVLSVDLGAIVRNWRALAGRAPGAHAAAVVKANGYGLGAGRVSVALAAAGCRSFFTATLEEAAAVEQALSIAGFSDLDVSVFAGFAPQDDPGGRLTPVLNHPGALEPWRHTGRPVAVHVDTAMGRLGVPPSDLCACDFSNLTVTALLSHLACADEPDHQMNQSQAAAFKDHVTLLRGRIEDASGRPLRASLAATGGTLLGEAYHFDMIRLGVGLYGGLPFADAEPVATLTAPIIQTRRIPKGAPVGYGADWIAPRDSDIASIPVGYADGLPRSLFGRGQVFLKGAAVPMVGRISMDTITLDVTDMGARIGDAVEILGPKQTVNDLAAASGTLGYEILTGLGNRFERRYTDSGF